MKNTNRWVTGIIAAALSFLLSWGAVGGLISAFQLPLADPRLPIAACAAAALLGGAAFSGRQGYLVLLAGAAAGFVLWRQGEFLGQLLRLLHHISDYYQRAYGWIAFSDAAAAPGAEQPAAVLGGALALITAWTVCRGESSFFPLSAASLPLLACLVVTDTVPGAGYLFLLFYAAVMLLLTAHVRAHSTYQGNRLALMIALPTALMLGILFLAVSKEGYVNHSAEIRGRILNWAQSLTLNRDESFPPIFPQLPQQEPEQVDLSTIGPQALSSAPVMTVISDFGGSMYLRGQDYDAYDGLGWSATAHRVEPFSLESGTAMGYVTIKTEAVMEQMYLPYYPGGSPSLIGGCLQNIRLAQEYTYPCLWISQAGGGSGLSQSAQSTYLSLPRDTRAQAEALLSGMTLGKDTATRAGVIAEYVRSSARYDLNASPMPEGQQDFALWFLEESDSGYCVHFATAATVLLRAAGIPARYVSGYLISASAGEDTTVTGENAHAWVEYFDPAVNVWRVLEATPAAGLPALTAPQIPQTQSQPQPTVAEEETLPEAPQPTVTLPQLSEPAGDGVPEAHSESSLDLSFLLWPLVPALVIILMEAQRQLRAFRRRSRQNRGDPNTQALARWQEAVLLARLLGEMPPDGLQALAEKAKYSQHTLTREELARFENYLRPMKRKLLSAPWYRRLLNRYLWAVQ